MPGPRHRFIPGYAGNACKSARFFRAKTVYPRLRGERKYYGKSVPLLHGLSPATRGTLVFFGENIRGARFIPGYAGNAKRGKRPSEIKPVYPRLRGERCDVHNGVIPKDGLSPATRGTHQTFRPALGTNRFIPGYAGNALLEGHRVRIKSVYPRLRGERTPRCPH